MTESKLQIVIPIHKSTLNKYETISLDRCFKILKQYTIVMIKPEQLNTTDIEKKYKFSRIEEFDKSYFKSISSYNRLMLSTSFYQKFESSKYILIFQPDVYIFFDNIDYWLSKDYDYIGAPWISSTPLSNKIHQIKMNLSKFFKGEKNIVYRFETRNRVGNGGFSLRKISTHINLSILLKDQIEHYLNNQGIHHYNEDIFWSIEPQKRGYSHKTPDVNEALNFAFDINPSKLYKLNNDTLPMACHGWFKKKHLKFWYPIINKFEKD